MTDLLGPASDQSVIVRPGRTITRGVNDTWFKDCTSPDANDGTAYTADYFNDMLAQLRTALRSSGIALDAGDDMLWRAMQSAGLRYAADTGTANHIAANFAVPVLALADGLALLIKVTNAVTGATDLTASAMAAKPLVWPNGSALASGDIAAGSVIFVVYYNGKFQLLSVMSGSSGSSVKIVKHQLFTNNSQFSTTVVSPSYSEFYRVDYTPLAAADILKVDLVAVAFAGLGAGSPTNKLVVDIKLDFSTDGGVTWTALGMMMQSGLESTSSDIYEYYSTVSTTGYVTIPSGAPHVLLRVSGNCSGALTPLAGIFTGSSIHVTEYLG